MDADPWKVVEFGAVAGGTQLSGDACRAIIELRDDGIDARREVIRQRDAAEARVRELEAALRTIQQWDCLNPPRPDLLGDLPWLRRLVDDALKPSSPGVPS